MKEHWVSIFLKNGTLQKGSLLGWGVGRADSVLCNTFNHRAGRKRLYLGRKKRDRMEVWPCGDGTRLDRSTLSSSLQEVKPGRGSAMKDWGAWCAGQAQLCVCRAGVRDPVCEPGAHSCLTGSAD